MNALGIAAEKEKRSCCMPPYKISVTYLADLKSGDSGVVTAIHGDESFRGKMLPLGIVPGTNIEVINGGHGRPFVLKVRDTRLMLDWKIVQKIAVSILSSAGKRRV